MKPELPFSPGGEIAGRIERVSESAGHFKPGDQVMAHIGFGGARDKIAIAADKLIAIPAGLADAWAAEAKIRPHIHRAYRSADASAALAAISSRQVKGKVVLVP